MNEPQPEEKLSGTLAGSIGRFFKALGRVPLAIRGVSAAVAAGGGVMLVLGLGLYLFVGDLRTFAVILMGLGGLLLLIAMMVSTEAVVAAATGRRGRYGANTAVMTVAFAGIAVLVNFLAFQSNARLDVTATKQFSLAPRSVELLRGLENPVRAIGFFRSIDAQQQVLTARVDDLLHEFKRRSNKFSYRFVDPDIDTVTAQEYGVTQYGTIIFEDTGTGRRQAVFVTPGQPVLEQDFVTGLLITTGKEQKRVYFLNGHGEADILDVDSDSAGGLAFDGLLRDNYLADSLNLLELAEVPKNTAVLIIAGPKKDFQPEEVTRLDSYLKLGGRMVVMVDPDAPQTVRDFLARWGVTLQQGQVIDVGRNVGSDPKIPLLQKGQYNTENLP
ncbi:MAG: GldG family protein, partial [Chloroflexota bacterium]|nr:GldG family protein [Chloroflexota bacterium]